MKAEIMENSRCRVLLIEDDKIDQMVFTRMVEQKNLPYDYTIAESFTRAKDTLASDRFDLIIVDYFLGDGTAFDVLELIEDTPVIFATGAGDEEIAVKAMKAGAYDYVIKDVERNYIKILPQTMERALVHKKTQEALKNYHENLEILVKQRTEQLAEEKELLTVTLGSMTDGVIAVDVEKRIIIFNKVAENLTKWKYEDVKGKKVDDIFHPIDEKSKKPLESPIDKVLSTRQTAYGSDRDALLAKDESVCPISATAAPLWKKNPDGIEMVGVVMVVRDVSVQREIDRMKSDFISSVTHELRTSLTSIKAYTETILRDSNMPEETKLEFLNVIDQESNLLQNLIEALLEVSRIESGSVKFFRKPVDITAVIKQVISGVQPLADKRNIQLKTDIAEELGFLQGDEGKIQSMVMNLVNNAIKFTPDSGQVFVSVARHEEELVIKVSDTGLGIPKDDLSKIFDRFYRVHRPGKFIQGTGLGLAIVKEIVNIHNGRIEVQSEVDKGTTFTVFLPINQNMPVYV